MRVMLLSPYPQALMPTFLARGDSLCITSDRASFHYIHWECRAEFIVSYGYRHMIPSDVVQTYPGRTVNLHISYLPWNRGADPNLWSWIDNTPKGVTLHEIEEGLDSGPILVQREVRFGENETLATPYWRLREEVENLFRENWSWIREGRIKPKNQGEGTRHLLAESKPIWESLPLGYDTPVELLKDWKK